MGLSRRAAKYGKKVAVIEASPRLGGTCVNVGRLFSPSPSPSFLGPSFCCLLLMFLDNAD